MMDAITWQDLLAALGALGILGGVYWRWSAVIGNVDKELQKHKLHVAETYATKHGVSEQMASVTKTMTDGFDRLDTRLGGVTDRLDRVIEYQHKPVKRQS